MIALRSTGTRRPALLAGALLVACLAPLPAVAAPEDEDAGLEVEITDLAPAVLTPGEPFTVSGTVTNHAAQDLAAGELQLSMQRHTPISRTALHRWMDPESYAITMLLAVEDLGTVEAGESAEFTVEVEPEDLDLPGTHTAWGPRGVEVAVTDTGGTTLADVDRSVALWYPDVEVEPTPVNVVVPIAPNSSERAAAEDATPGATAADVAAPRLLELLEQLDLPGVTIAVDGELLAPPSVVDPGTEPGVGDPGGPEDGEAAEEAEAPETDAATEEPRGEAGETDGDTAPGGPDPEGPGEDGSGDAFEPGSPAAELLAALSEHAAGERRHLALLPWADADLAALAHAGATDHIEEAATSARAAAQAAGLDGELLAWPATTVPDAVTVERAAEHGATAALLPVSSLSPLEDLTYTPAGRADLDVGSETIPAVLVDDTASDVLTGSLPPVPGTGAEAIDLGPLDVRQMLLADLAVIARERPADPRAVTIAVPRSVAAGSREDALGEALDELLAAPWVEPATLAEVRDLPAPELDRSALPEEEVDPAELAEEDLDRMAEVRAAARAYAGVTEDPAELLEPISDHLRALFSSAWRADPGARGESLDRVSAEVEALDAALVPLESSSLNVINYSASLPVHVRNDLPSDATVQVSLDPSDGRLQTEGPVTVTIPAESQATAQIPVRAVGSGDVSATIRLHDAEGTEIGTPNELRVRVRADWETVGTAVIAGVLGVMLVIGLVRTVRGGRRMAPATEATIEAEETTERGEAGEETRS